MTRQAVLIYLVVLTIVTISECAPKDRNPGTVHSNSDKSRHRPGNGGKRRDAQPDEHLIQKRSCDLDEFQCGTGECITAEYRCDYYIDCHSDFSDEINCPCPYGYSDCGADDVCIPDSWKCDGWSDCLGDSDETDCDFLCNDGSLTLQNDQVCNHVSDCRDGSDELGAYCDPMTESFSLSSPGYPQSYPEDVFIEWAFTAAAGQFLTFDCSSLDLEDGVDWLIIGNGHIPGFDVTAELTGSSCQQVSSDKNEMWISFQSDYSVSGEGFQGTVKVESNNPPAPAMSFTCADGLKTLTDDNVCNHVLDCADGSDEVNNNCGYLSDPFALSSPNYPLRYNTNVDIVWVFEAMSGQSLTFHCESFHTEDIYDTVTIGNGLNPNQGSTREFSGTRCYDVTSDGNQMWIKFHSDYSETAKGFEGKVAIAVPRDDLCGYNNEVVNTRIVGGRDTVIERWPWQILLIEIDGDHKYQKCGGTLITPGHVLTAAHCFDRNDSPDKYLVALAKNSTGNSLHDIKRKVIDIAVHEGFDDNTFKNDIAILTLESEVTVPRSGEDLAGDNPVNTACFDYDGDWNEESECYVTGYGVVDVATDTTADKLQEAEIVYLSADACRDNTDHSMIDILPTMICGASPPGNVVKDSCQGDSGGPLVCRSKLDTLIRYYVAGITSWGYDCGDADLPGVYTSVKDYKDWISSHI